MPGGFFVSKKDYDDNKTNSRGYLDVLLALPFMQDIKGNASKTSPPLRINGILHMPKPTETKSSQLSKLAEEVMRLQNNSLIMQQIIQEPSVSKKIIQDDIGNEKVNVAIFIGVSDYGSTESNLPQCNNDVSLISEIISKVKKPHHTLKMSGKVGGREASDKLIDFFKEIKEKSIVIDELFFYFTGHGIAHELSEREAESRLVFSDYSQNRINETTISSDFIDDLARDASPNTYVKIIDSCYSGSKLIKNTIEQRERFLSIVSKDKSHYEKIGFNNVYVMASSRSDQVSFANSKYSDFSESIFLALSDLPGDIKYRHLVNRLADDFSTKEQRPVFVMQGSFDEGFGEISPDIKTFIYNELTSEKENTSEAKDNNSSSNADKDEILLKELEAKIKAITMARIFSPTDLNNYICFIDGEIKSITKKLLPFYTCSIVSSEKKILPNEVVIGEWLKNSSHSYFATPRYRKIEPSIQAIAPPRNNLQTQTNNSSDEKRLVGFLFENMNEEEKESRVRQVLLTPKKELKILDAISINIAVIHSHERITIFSSIESCPLIDWDEYANPKCRNWKANEIKTPGKKEEVKKDIESIFDEFKQFAINLIKIKSTNNEAVV